MLFSPHYTVIFLSCLGMRQTGKEEIEQEQFQFSLDRIVSPANVGQESVQSRIRLICRQVPGDLTRFLKPGDVQSFCGGVNGILPTAERDGWHAVFRHLGRVEATGSYTYLRFFSSRFHGFDGRLNDCFRNVKLIRLVLQVVFKFNTPVFSRFILKC